MLLAMGIEMGCGIDGSVVVEKVIGCLVFGLGWVWGNIG